MIELGFSENNIKIEEAYTDDIEKGIVYEMEPSGEKRVQTKDGITLKVSKGMYYTLEDYTYQNFEEVKQMLEEKFLICMYLLSISRRHSKKRAIL